MVEPTGTRAFAPFEWMLSMRYLRARRREGFISVIAKFSFLGINRAGATTSEVLITDILGQEWLADFEMERQENGDWRVKGCVVQANPGQRA